MILLLAAALPVCAQDDPWSAELADPPPLDAPSTSDASLPASGLAVGAVGGGSGVSLGQSSVVGGDGGTTVWTAQTQLRWDSWIVAAQLPFATYRDAAGRTTGLGNLRLDLIGLDSPTDPRARYGVELHLPVGQAWTWVNDAESVWPGAGMNVVYGRLWRPGETTLLLRAAAGLHFTQGYEPYPSALFKAELAGAVDQPLADVAGVIGEVSVAYWDPTPVDVAGLVRVDPVEGLRLRGGLILPLLSWTGAQPAEVPAGVREATVRLDVSMTL